MQNMATKEMKILSFLSVFVLGSNLFASGLARQAPTEH